MVLLSHLHPQHHRGLDLAGGDVPVGPEQPVLVRHHPEAVLLIKPDGARVVTASSDKIARVVDAEWLVAIHGAELGRRACQEKLVPGSEFFTFEDAADPILSGLAGTNPCERRGPLSLRYWTRLFGWN